MSAGAGSGEEVAVIGGGVVGCAVLHALARRGVPAVLFEAQRALALGASGANSGILHTGFDSKPGELETRLILRAAALREHLLDELGVAVWRCGAALRAADAAERDAVAALAAGAAANGVRVELDAAGVLRVPGEAVTDPVAYVEALAAAAVSGGAVVRLGARVARIAPNGTGLGVELCDGERIAVSAAVNCAGLYADELAAAGGDELPAVYPRKGEFLVFEQPAGDELREILLPLPGPMGKGVLVFPTLDGHVVAGPTARDRRDKSDWSVEPDAEERILQSALRAHPPLASSRLVGAYAGLRPAGRDANYVIVHSPQTPRLVHVAAIRSTGLSASLGIGEHVAAMLADAGVAFGPERALQKGTPAPARAWWELGPRGRADEAPA